MTAADELSTLQGYVGAAHYDPSGTMVLAGCSTTPTMKPPNTTLKRLMRPAR